MAAIPLQPCRGSPAALRRHVALDALDDTGRWVRATLHDWRRRHRDRQELARLDARTLADIGLTRGEAEFLINRPFWRK